MQMTDSEIRTSYTQAKDKQNQIGVLADMNLVDKFEMEHKLVELGLLTDAESFNFTRCAQLYAEGKTDLEISEMLGEPKSRVAKWRKSKGFRANYPTQENRKPRKSPEPKSKTAAAAPKVPPAVPPIGIIPEDRWKRQRYIDLCKAITRYVVAGLKPLPEWIDEARRFAKELPED